MKYESYLDPGEPLSRQDERTIDGYLAVINHAAEAKTAIREDSLAARLAKFQAIQDDMETRCTELSRMLSSDGVAALLVILARRNGVEVEDDSSGLEYLADIKEAAPVCRLWQAMVRNGLNEQGEREKVARAKLDAERAKLIADSKQVAGERWKTGVVESREWMRAAVKSRVSEDFIEAVLRGWEALEFAKWWLVERETHEPKGVLEKNVADHNARVREYWKVHWSQRPREIRKLLLKEKIDIAKNKESLDRRRIVGEFVAGFTAGINLPGFMNDAFEAHFIARWGKPARNWKGACSKTNLVYLTDEFDKARYFLRWREFWEKHGAAYTNALKRPEDALRRQEEQKDSGYENRAGGMREINAKKAHRYCVEAVTQFLRTRGRRQLSQELKDFRFGKKPSSWIKARGVVGDVMNVADYEKKVGSKVEGLAITRDNYTTIRKDLPEKLKGYYRGLRFEDPQTGIPQAETTAAVCLSLVEEADPKRPAKRDA